MGVGVVRGVCCIGDDGSTKLELAASAESVGVGVGGAGLGGAGVGGAGVGGAGVGSAGGEMDGTGVRFVNIVASLRLPSPGVTRTIHSYVATIVLLSYVFWIFSNILLVITSSFSSFRAPESQRASI